MTSNNEDQAKNRRQVLGGAAVGAGLMATGASAQDITSSRRMSPDQMALLKTDVQLSTNVRAQSLRDAQVEEIAKNAITLEAMKIADTLKGPGASSYFGLTFDLTIGDEFQQLQRR